jgi:hypothetical protein
MTWHYIKRTIEPVLADAARHFPALAITGPRQSGKSTLLKHCFPNHTVISFDDPLNRSKAVDDPRLLLATNQGRLILDEIQYVPELLSYIKMSIDDDRRNNGRFLLTGSQRFALMKNLSDSLAGRISILELLPFDLQETAAIAPANESGIENFVRACLRGAYPELVLNAELGRDTWYSAYMQTYLERDISSIYNIGDLREFTRFLRLLAGRCGQQLNLSGLAGDVGVSVNTIKRWISVLEAGRIIFLLEPYHKNFGKRVVKSPKVYFTDCGFVCYLTGISDRDQLLKGPLAGPLFENFCIQETLKVLINNGKMPRLYYFRIHSGPEIDLLVEGPGLKLLPVEIKMNATPNMGMAVALEKAMGELSGITVHKTFITCLCEEPVSLRRTITAIPVNGFLSELVSFIRKS